MLFFFVMKIESEVRSIARAADLEWKFGAGSVFVKEGIDRLQQNRFPPRSHLRELRIHSYQTVEIEGVSIQGVFARHIRVRPGYQKMQVREREGALAQPEGTRQIRRYTRFCLPFDDSALALRAQAQRIDLSLNFFVGKRTGRNVKVAIESEPIGNFHIPAGHFTNEKVQGQIDSLSLRTQGK